MQVVNNKSNTTFRHSINDQITLSDQNKDIESHIAQYGKKNLQDVVSAQNVRQSDDEFVVIEDNNGNLV